MASQPATVTATVAEEAFRNLLSKFEENFSSRGRFLKNKQNSTCFLADQKFRMAQIEEAI